MDQLEAPAARRTTVVGLAALGVLAVAGGAFVGPEIALAGAFAVAAGAVLAMREMTTPTVTWPNAVAAFLLVVWFIPAKGYRLPVSLPFNLEPYRLALALILVVLLVAVLTGRARLEYLGFGVPLALLAGGATVSALLNYDQIGDLPGETGAFRSLSYFLGFLAVFVLIASTIKTHDGLDTAARAIVIGATLAALSALYESRSGYNIFTHLDEWIPALVREERATFDVRGGNLRVFASAQHPIALSCALFMSIPLAVYLIGRASSQARARLWIAAALICALGAVATISRTTVIMGVALLLVGFWLRRNEIVRYWPLLLLLPIVIHFATPGALGGIYNAFFPEEGLAGDLASRQGEAGSGRLADVEPGIRLWEQAPIFGKSVGAQYTTGEAQIGTLAEGVQGVIIYFDNQWLNTLVSLGVVGLVATFWFVWGSFGSIARFARRVRGPRSDLAAACAASVAAFGVSMLVFDAFAFVQATIIFFAIAALGLQARRLGPRPADLAG
jgi:O-Antigen ligase